MIYDSSLIVLHFSFKICSFTNIINIEMKQKKKGIYNSRNYCLILTTSFIFNNLCEFQ